LRRVKAKLYRAFVGIDVDAVWASPNVQDAIH